MFCQQLADKNIKEKSQYSETMSTASSLRKSKSFSPFSHHLQISDFVMGKKLG